MAMTDDKKFFNNFTNILWVLRIERYMAVSIDNVNYSNGPN